MRHNHYHHLGWLHGVELYEAAFRTQTFARHAHMGFAIGAIAEGTGGYFCRGENIVLPAGSLSLMNPEVAHTGHATAGRVRYNMLYASEEAVREILGLRELHGFPEVAPHDRGLMLTCALARLAECLNTSVATDRNMAIEEAVHEVLELAFTNYARTELRRPGHEARAIRTVLNRIRSGVEVGEDLRVSNLAAEAGLSPSYLIRTMARATGLTPHRHVLCARIDYARRLLLQGMPAAEAAIVAGFCDQAHLIRHFRRHHGVTPGSLIRH